MFEIQKYKQNNIVERKKYREIALLDVAISELIFIQIGLEKTKCLLRNKYLLQRNKKINNILTFLSLFIFYMSKIKYLKITTYFLFRIRHVTKKYSKNLVA